MMSLVLLIVLLISCVLKFFYSDDKILTVSNDSLSEIPHENQKRPQCFLFGIRNSGKTTLANLLNDKEEEHIEATGTNSIDPGLVICDGPGEKNPQRERFQSILNQNKTNHLAIIIINMDRETMSNNPFNENKQENQLKQSKDFMNWMIAEMEEQVKNTEQLTFQVLFLFNKCDVLDYFSDSIRRGLSGSLFNILHQKNDHIEKIDIPIQNQAEILLWNDIQDILDSVISFRGKFPLEKLKFSYSILSISHSGNNLDSPLNILKILKRIGIINNKGVGDAN